MQRGYALRFVHLFTIIVIIAQLLACAQPVTDESRLRRAVAEMEKAAESKDLRPILDYLSDDFLGNQVYRKANIGAMLFYHMRQNRRVHVFLHIASITISSGRAQLRCEVLLAGRDKRIVPEHARVLVIDSVWQKLGGQWRVVRASWRDPLLQP